MSSNGTRVIVRLVSSAGTGQTYATTKNKRTTPGRLRLVKYDRVERRHLEFVESK